MRLRLTALLLTLALGLLAAPLPAEAQKRAGKVYRIGWLAQVVEPFENSFRVELRDLGWVEGQNFAMEYRRAEAERLPALAGELAQHGVDIFLTVGTPATRAAMNVTKTIPIVFTAVADPVESGFVASLAYPGRNVTGVTNLFPELAAKQLELLTEAIPGISRVAVLWDPNDPGNPLILKQMQLAAQALGVILQPVEVKSARDFEPAFSAVTRKHAEGLIVLTSPLMNSDWVPILALRNRLPMMSNSSRLTWQEGLMSYAPDVDAMGRRAAQYIDKILKGTNPANLPVEQPMHFEFTINLHTAKALGLKIPDSVLFRADQVIR